MRALGKSFWLTLIVVLFVRGLFVLTYPLNVSGDGVTYFRMIPTRTSNLTHASGYPFLVGLPLAVPRAVVAALRPSDSALLTPDAERRSGSPAVGAAPPPIDLEIRQALMPLLTLYVTIFNHLVNVLAAICLFLLLRAVFSATAGVVSGLVYGLNPWNIQWATLSRPEQVQSDLVVLMLGVLYFARKTASSGWKRVGYAVAAVLFVLGILAKFNAVLLVGLPVVFLVTDPSSRVERIRLGVLSLVTALGLYGAFVVLYHAPSTGTYSLSYGVGHALYVRLERNPVPLFRPENGIASMKFAILTRGLPPEAPSCCGPTLFSHVNWVPEEERRPYRERYLPLLRSNDEGAVKQIYAAVRDRPAGAWTSIYYYLGLREGDDLLRAVFFESVRARPGVYLAGAWRFFLDIFVERQEVLVPVVDPQLGADPPLNVLADPRNLEPLRFGFVRISSSEYRSRELAYKGSPAIWLPGARLVSGLLSVTSVPTLLLWAVIGIGAALSLRGTGADPGSARWGPLLVLAIMLAYFAGWSLLFNIRNKDVRLVQPLFDGLVAVGLWRIGEWIRRGAAGRFRAWS